MIIKKILEIFSAKIFLLPSQFFLNILLIKWLGAEIRGLHLSLLALIGFINPFIQFGSQSSAIYFIKKKIYSLKITALILIIHFIIFFLILFVINHFFNLKFLIFYEINIYFFLFFLLVFILSNFCQNILIGLGHSKYYALISISSFLIYFLVCYTFYLFESLNYKSLLYSSIFYFFLISVFSLTLFIKIDKNKFKFKLLNIRILKLYYSYSFKRLLTIMNSNFLLNFPNLFLSYYLTSSYVTYFSLANSIYNLFATFIRTSHSYIFGFLVDKNISIKKSIITKTIFWLIIYSLIVNLFYFIFIKDLVINYFGNEFNVSVLTGYFLIFSLFFISISGSIETFFLSDNQPGIVLKISISNTLISIILIFTLFQFFDFLGLSIAIFITRLIILYFYINKYIK